LETKGAILCYTNLELVREHVDLSDELARAIIVVGVPCLDPREIKYDF